MEQYKADFIDFLLSSGALKIGGPFKLKSGRMSPYFINMGALEDGVGLLKLGEFYAQTILHEVGKKKFDLIFGPPYKGITLAVSTAIALAGQGVNKGYAFYRKEEKAYGEATGSGITKEEIQKKLIIGHPILNGSKVLWIDDVFTTGDTKEEAENILYAVADDVKIVGGVIGADRQELNEDGEAAIKQFTESRSTPVFSVIRTTNIIDYLYETNKLSPVDESAMKRYLRAWGTKEARERYGLGKERLIEGKTVIPACDTDLVGFEEIVKATGDMEKIGGYKIPARSGRKGWETWVEVARKYTKKPLIYDHQKAGTDVPDTGQDFMKDVKEAGFDAIIIFPESGPRTQVACTGEALQQGLQVLIGGEMTHPKYKRSEGGYIADEALEEMYIRGAKQGVTHFVVPGNKVDRIKLYREIIQQEVPDPTFFSPGFVAQGGKIDKATEVAGDHWHAIVGRAIKDAKDIRAAATEMTSKL
jgi:orotidine-5'-phosphate decarboxylase